MNRFHFSPYYPYVFASTHPPPKSGASPAPITQLGQRFLLAKCVFCFDTTYVVLTYEYKTLYMGFQAFLRILQQTAYGTSYSVVYNTIYTICGVTGVIIDKS